MERETTSKVSQSRIAELLEVASMLSSCAEMPFAELAAGFPNLTRDRLGRNLQLLQAWQVIVYSREDRAWHLSDPQWAAEICTHALRPSQRMTPTQRAARNRASLRAKIMRALRGGVRMSGRELEQRIGSPVKPEHLAFLMKTRKITAHVMEGETLYGAAVFGETSIDSITQGMAALGASA